MTDDAKTTQTEARKLSDELVLRPELHSYAMGNVLDVAEEELGVERVNSWLEEWGVDARRLIASQAWISWEFAELLIRRVVDETNPGIVDRIGRLAISPKHMGAIYPFLRGLATPAFTYDRMAKSTPRFNKALEALLERRGPTELTIRFRPIVPGFKRTETAYACGLLRAQVASVPVLFDLPPARVEHSKCFHRGDEECVYEVEWDEPSRRVSLWLVLALGAATGGLVSWLVDVPSSLFAFVTVLTGVATWATTLAYRQRRDLAERIEDIWEHHDALTRSVRDNEQRFEELLEAKREVEAKVEERTAELRETGKRLEETLEEVRALDQAKTSFFSNVSHELRTPLTLILGPLEELRAGREPPGGATVALDAMNRNATRLLTLINQLLDLAKIDAGATQISRQQVDVRQLAFAVVDAFRAAAQRKSVRLELQAEETKPIALDASWIDSALTNLVANALRFVEEGGEVRVGIADRGSEVQVTVSDDGRGMDSDDLARVFDRFTQVGEGGRERVGTGLGLAIVREAARLHDGDASVESAPGEGTTFTLRFPRVVDAPLEYHDSTDSSSADAAAALLASDERSSDREGPDPSAPLALVVEDNPELRAHVADVLSARYRVRTAGDGREGLALAKELVPDVILSDVAMPTMDGMQLCRRLRATDETRQIPVLLVTAYRDVPRILEGFEAGADDYVPKPFHGRELLARVDVHVRLRRMIHELAHQERLATLGTVAASVAHQVRNPLTTIMSGLPAMRGRLGDTLDEPSREMFEVMIDCAERIERLTLDLLDLSRVDREEQGTFQPGEGLSASARLVGARVPPTVDIDLDVDHTPVLRGRAGDMNHVFLNLVDNAARAVGDEGTIRIRGFLDDGVYVVEVGDSGSGVPAGTSARIFEPFFSTRAAGVGSGLGLAIAKQVVDQHGGSIAVDRSDLGGALFRVRLPGATRAGTVASIAGG